MESRWGMGPHQAEKRRVKTQHLPSSKEGVSERTNDSERWRAFFGAERANDRELVSHVRAERAATERSKRARYGRLRGQSPLTPARIPSESAAGQGGCHRRSSTGMKFFLRAVGQRVVVHPAFVRGTPQGAPIPRTADGVGSTRRARCWWRRATPPAREASRQEAVWATVPNDVAA